MGAVEAWGSSGEPARRSGGRGDRSDGSRPKVIFSFFRREKTSFFFRATKADRREREKEGGKRFRLLLALFLPVQSPLFEVPGSRNDAFAHPAMRPAESSQQQPGSSGDKSKGKSFDARVAVAPAQGQSSQQQPFRLGRLAFSQVQNNSQQQCNMMTASQDLNVALSGCSLNSQQQQQAKAMPPPPPPLPKWNSSSERQRNVAPAAPAPAPPPPLYDEPGCDLPLSQLAPQSQIDAYMLG